MALKASLTSHFFPQKLCSVSNSKVLVKISRIFTKRFSHWNYPLPTGYSRHSRFFRFFEKKWANYPNVYKLNFRLNTTILCCTEDRHRQHYVCDWYFRFVATLLVFGAGILSARVVREPGFCGSPPAPAPRIGVILQNWPLEKKSPLNFTLTQKILIGFTVDVLRKPIFKMIF